MISARAGAVAALLLVAAACGGGEPASSSSGSGASSSSPSSSPYGSDPAGAARSFASTASGAIAAGDLPPRTLRGLQPLYGPAVEPLGVRLTRGLVLPLQAGPHLQLYVEPTGTAISPQDYLARIIPLIRATGVGALKEYADLVSFDVCQEPPPGVDDSPDPPPDVLVFLTRAQVESLDWSTATLRDLRRVVRDMPGGQLKVKDEIAALPEWRASEP